MYHCKNNLDLAFTKELNIESMNLEEIIGILELRLHHNFYLDFEKIKN